MGISKSLAILLFHLWFFWVLPVRAQLPSPHSTTSARAAALDALLQNYAYKAFVRPKTGLPYEGKVPANITGIKITALRLRNGSLRTRGVETYREFSIPTGIFVKPYVERLALVYQNLGNWSQQYYPLPAGYTYLAPLLGLLVYNASELSDTFIAQLRIKTSVSPILANFSNNAKLVAGAKCVWFDLQGSVSLRELGSGYTCEMMEQGHVSVVAKTADVAVAVAPSDPQARVGAWAVACCVVGGVLVIGALAFLVRGVRNRRRRSKIQQMERMAEGGEVLRVASVGEAKAPVAMFRRTQPIIETEYVP